MKVYNYNVISEIPSELIAAFEDVRLYQMAEHFQTAVNLTNARVGYVFLPSSAKDFVPDAVVL